MKIPGSPPQAEPCPPPILQLDFFNGHGVLTPRLRSSGFTFGTFRSRSVLKKRSASRSVARYTVRSFALCDAQPPRTRMGAVGVEFSRADHRLRHEGNPSDKTRAHRSRCRGGRKAIDGPDEAWIAADPFRGGFKVLITGPHGLERTAVFANDDEPGVISERIRETLAD